MQHLLYYSEAQYNFISGFILPLVDASVIISPSHGYTTFENNASTFTFNCSGTGTSLLWTVMDTQLVHHMHSIKEYNTHPSSYHQMDLLCPLSSLFQPPKLTPTLQSSVQFRIHYLTISLVIISSRYFEHMNIFFDPDR